MVQLPATAAIEYVAACWVSGAGGIFVRGCLLSGGLMPVSPNSMRIYAPSRLSVPSMIYVYPVGGRIQLT